MGNFYRDFVKHRLAWLDRTLTFRSAIKRIPFILNRPNEQLVDTLVADFLSTRRSPFPWVLTTHQLLCLRPFISTDIHGWDGATQIIFFKNIHPERTIKVRVFTKPNDEKSAKEFGFQYAIVNEINAHRFANLCNILSISRLWGNPAKFNDFLAEEERKLKNSL